MRTQAAMAARASLTGAPRSTSAAAASAPFASPPTQARTVSVEAPLSINPAAAGFDISAARDDRERVARPKRSF